MYVCYLSSEFKAEGVNPEEHVLGVEATRRETVGWCDQGNIDPQNSGRQPDLAAIEMALDWPLPSEGTVLVTDRADVASVGAMAVLSMRFDERELTADIMERIKLIAEADKAARGEWPGPRPLPTRENPWPDSLGPVDSRPDLAPLGAAVSTYSMSLDERVDIMYDWLLDGVVDKRFRLKVDKDQVEMIDALEHDEIDMSTQSLSPQHRLAVIRSNHRAAISLGYRLAPVVLAVNDKFQSHPDETPHVKMTIAQFTGGYIIMEDLIDYLNMIDPAVDNKHTWGGQGNLIGSPQGVSTELTPEEVEAAIASFQLQ